jgi:transcriptional regulator with XRE-family HTH domain
MVAEPVARNRPDAAHALLGSQLRVLREARGLAPEDARRCIGGSLSKISRVELGRIGVKDDDLDRLLTLYGVTNAQERQAMLRLSCRLNAAQWWDSYSDILPGWFRSYLVLESIAEYIRTYEVRFIPGLLQTAAYAEAVIRLHYRDEAEIRRRVEVRMQRQQMLLRPGAAKLWAVVDEAALYEQIAGRAAMREQVDYLLDMATRPNVPIQILPTGHAGRVGIGNSFSMLRLRMHNLSDVVYLEHIGSALFLKDRNELDPYTIAMNRLAVASANPNVTVKKLQAARRAI